MQKRRLSLLLQAYLAVYGYDKDGGDVAHSGLSITCNGPFAKCESCDLVFLHCPCTRLNPRPAVGVSDLTNWQVSGQNVALAPQDQRLMGGGNGWATPVLTTTGCNSIANNPSIWIANKASALTLVHMHDRATLHRATQFHFLGNIAGQCAVLRRCHQTTKPSFQLRPSSEQAYAVFRWQSVSSTLITCKLDGGGAQTLIALRMTQELRGECKTDGLRNDAS